MIRLANGYFRKLHGMGVCQLSYKMEFQQQVAIVFVQSWSDKPHENGFKLQHTWTTCEKRWAGWQQFYQHGSFSAVPRRDLIAVKSMWQREWTRQAAPSERKTGGRDAHPLRWKPLLYWLNFAGSSSVTVTPCQLPTTLSTTCRLLSSNCL